MSDQSGRFQIGRVSRSFDRKIALIGCSKRKLKGNHKAKDLYQGSLFKKSLELALIVNFDEIYILSAKYGLLSLDDEIESYDESLNDRVVDRRRQWADEVFMKLPLGNYSYFCGRNYWEFLPEGKKMYEGKSIGMIVKNLNLAIKKAFKEKA